MPFWSTLKQGYDYFETTRKLPTIAVCERRYLVNVKWRAEPARVDPEGRCPAYEQPALEPFVPTSRDQIADAQRITVQGPKLRSVASAGGSATGDAGTGSGLFGMGLGSGGPKSSTPAFGFSQ